MLNPADRFPGVVNEVAAVLSLSPPRVRRKSLSTSPAQVADDGVIEYDWSQLCRERRETLIAIAAIELHLYSRGDQLLLTDAEKRTAKAAADRSAGYVLGYLGLDARPFGGFLWNAGPGGDASHPPILERLEQIRLGFVDGATAAGRSIPQNYLDIFRV